METKHRGHREMCLHGKNKGLRSPIHGFCRFVLYLCLLPLCLICYGLAKKPSTKNIVLIVFSLIFYAWGEPLWILLLLFSSFFNWFIGILIGKFRDTPRAKLAVGGGIFVDILLLLIFKYSAFIVENLNAVSGAAIPVPQITLPIGISFYTFQAISYILDCYWETVDVQPKYHKFLLYLSLFPQLIAGPIVRYSVVEQEIDNRSVNATDLCEGALRVILGLAKRSSSRTICGPSSTRSSARTSQDFLCSAHGTPSSCIRCMFTLTSAVIPILPSASVACLASTLTKTSVIRLPAPPLRSSGSAGTSPSAPSSATTFVRAVLRQAAQVFRPVPCLVLHRSLARCRMELHFMGPLLRLLHAVRAENGQKAHEKVADRVEARVYEACHHPRLWHLLF